MCARLSLFDPGTGPYDDASSKGEDRRMTSVATELPQARASRAKLRRLVPLILLVVAVAAWGIWKAYERTRPLEWSGTVEARTIAIGSRIGGRVKEVHFREGDNAKEGQPIVTLELGDLEAQKLVAAGQLEQAKATLDKLERGARPEELAAAKARATTAQAAFAEARAGARKEQIGAARARLAQAQAQVDKAESDAQRGRRMFSSQAISQSEMDAVEAAMRSAVAQRDAAKAALDELESGVRREELVQAQARAHEAEASMQLVAAGSRVEDIRAARGAVEAAEGRLKQTLVSIDELTIRAPRDARIESLDLRPGDILAPNAPAATLLEVGQLYVRIYVPETQLGYVKVGADVPIYVDTFPGRPFKGVIESVNSVGEYTPRNLQTADERADHVFATRVGIRDGEGTLRAGMAAFVRVPR
jgi:multidrug resistance efflux pump